MMSNDSNSYTDEIEGPVASPREALQKLLTRLGEELNNEADDPIMWAGVTAFAAGDSKELKHVDEMTVSVTGWPAAESDDDAQALITIGVLLAGVIRLTEGLSTSGFADVLEMMNALTEILAADKQASLLRQVQKVTDRMN